MPPEPEQVPLRLTVPEAVVLHGLLQRYQFTGTLTIEDQAEQRALWNLEALHEALDGASWPSHARARDLLRDPVGEPPAHV